VARLNPCPSFINTIELGAIYTVVDSLDQPDSVRAKLSSKQSTTCIVKKPVVPLIWTALKFSRPFGTGRMRVGASEMHHPTRIPAGNTLITLKVGDRLHVEGLWK
jgi:hypothetical protein